MGEQRIFYQEVDGFASVGMIGTGIPLQQGLENYRQKGSFRERADFSPLMQQLDEFGPHLFLSGNLYTPKPCNMTVAEYNPPVMGFLPLTIFCYGFGDITREFALDFSKIMEMQTQEPPKAVITQVILNALPLRLLIKQCQTRRINPEQILSAAWQMQNEKYRQEAGN